MQRWLSIDYILLASDHTLMGEEGGGGGKTDTPTNYIQFVPNLSPDKVFCFRAKTHVFVYSTDMTASDAS